MEKCRGEEAGRFPFPPLRGTPATGPGCTAAATDPKRLQALGPGRFSIPGQPEDWPMRPLNPIRIGAKANPDQFSGMRGVVGLLHARSLHRKLDGG